MLDAVLVRVGDWCGLWGERDWWRFGGRNDGGFVIRRKKGVITIVVISINEGKMTIVGPIGVAPTLKDGGTYLVVGLDVMLGVEGDS
jgi:hypothetical protein